MLALREEAAGPSRPRGGVGGGLEGLLVGRVLAGRYEILDVVGRGGMGVVYRALDRSLERPVAVKVLAGSAGGRRHDFLRARFAREAKAAASIRHPNVVTVYDHGTDEDVELDFLVMEMLEGEDLGRLVRKLGLPRVASTLRLLGQAAAGVAAGHREGLVHRDIKPANLFLETGAGEVRLKVLDFGIAEAAPNQVATMASSGGETLHALSPAFASPEQLRAEPWLTPASDVFSLGAVAYHLLTGERIWSSLDPNRAILEMEQARASFLEDRRLPLRLREVVTKALASHPRDRFRDGRELLVALDEVRAAGFDRAEDARHATETAAAPRSPAPGSPAPHVAASAKAPSDRAVPEWLLYQTAGVRTVETAAVLAVISSIAYLGIAGGVWNTLLVAMVILAGAALLPSSDTIAGSLRFSALALPTIVLLGVMLSRAVLGSVADLLFAQIILTGIAPWLTGARTPASPDLPPHLQDSW